MVPAETYPCLEHQVWCAPTEGLLRTCGCKNRWISHRVGPLGPETSEGSLGLCSCGRRRWWDEVPG